VLTSRLYESPDDLGALRAVWDELAVDAQRPFSAPAWALAWWENLRPADAQLRLVAVHDGDSLAGVVPLFSRGRTYQPVGGGMAPVEPLARAGLERQVAEAAVATFAEATPPPATFALERHGSSPDWAELLGEAWINGRGAWRWTKSETPVPRVDLGEGFEDWMKSQSSSFRREMKRKRRKFDEAGASFRYATGETLERDVNAFMRLHRHRLAGQGGSSLTSDRVERMLIGVGSELLASGRFRLLCIDLNGEPIGAQLLLAAGREVSAWNSGFDESYAKLSPSMQCIVEALRDASERGERTMSLGPGGQDYKYRLSNGEDSLNSHVLVPHGARYPLTRLRLAPQQARHGFGKRLSPEAKQRLRGLIRR
jgi:CelD/BcsL family acetyltransferase involved in cellulose biosynthesis